MSREAMQGLDRSGDRFMELEGLRGVAAIVVVIFHLLIIFYPVLYYGQSILLAPIQHSNIESIIHGTPLGVLISGTFSVAVFFVLSGFVLSVGFFKTQQEKIIKKLATKRYLRLMIPALASVLICWALISLGFSNVTQAHAISQSGGLAGQWAVIPNFFDAIRQAVWSIFFTEQHDYNSVLWTMRYEFIGSFIVFATALLFGRSTWRWLIYGLLIIALHNTWYLGFLFGMGLADIYVCRETIFKSMNKWLSYSALLAGLAIGGYPAVTSIGTVYNLLTIPWLTESQNQSLYTALGAMLVITAILSIGWLSIFFASKSISQFGKYTYSLYLSHQPIIFTLCTGLFVYFNGHTSYNKSVFLAILLTVPVIVVGAVLFYRFIEQPSLRIVNLFEEIFSGKRKITAGHFIQYVSRPADAMYARLAMRSRVAINTEVEVEAE